MHATIDHRHGSPARAPPPRRPRQAHRGAIIGNAPIAPRAPSLVGGLLARYRATAPAPCRCKSAAGGVEQASPPDHGVAPGQHRRGTGMASGRRSQPRRGSGVDVVTVGNLRRAARHACPTSADRSAGKWRWGRGSGNAKPGSFVHQSHVRSTGTTERSLPHRGPGRCSNPGQSDRRRWPDGVQVPVDACRERNEPSGIGRVVAGNGAGLERSRGLLQQLHPAAWWTRHRPTAPG